MLFSGGGSAGTVGVIQHTSERPEMSPRRAVVAVSVGALTLALAACDPGAAEPTATPSSVAPSTSEASTSAAPTEEPTSAAPEVPAPNPADFPGMDQQTEDGAKQAYAFFWETYRFAMVTGDSQPFANQFTPDCNWCIAISNEITSNGSIWKSATVTASELDAYVVGEGHFEVYTVLDVDPEWSSADFDNGREDRLRGGRYVAGSNVIWLDGSWKVASVDFEVADA